MISLQQLLEWWNHFFFHPVPVYPVALFRMALAAVLLADALFIVPHLAEFLGPDGMVGFERYRRRSLGQAFSLFLVLPPTMRSVRAIMALHLTAVVMMGLGLFTPLSTAVVFVTLRSIVNRNPGICNGGDNVARIMCFFLIFAPAGAVWSLDALLFHPAHASATAVLHAPWALRLMQVQVSVIYLKTVYWKLKGATYRNGTAIYYAATNDAYKRLALPGFVLRAPGVQAATWGTLALESLLGAGVWIRELRGPLVVAGIAFHFGIDFFLNVHLFGWYMMASLLLFLGPGVLPGL